MCFVIFLEHADTFERFLMSSLAATCIARLNLVNDGEATYNLSTQS